MTIRAGEFVIRVGRKIIEVIGFLIRTFPKASSGLIIGAMIGSLAASVPVLGFMLGTDYRSSGHGTWAGLGGSGGYPGHEHEADGPRGDGRVREAEYCVTPW